MTEPIRGFFENQIGANATPIYTDRESEERRRLQLAACALLLELAHADDEFSDAERGHIHGIIRRYFGLDEDGANELLELSERERAEGANLHQFADLIREGFDPVRKATLVEVMWGLASSDGKIAEHESYLLSRIAGLLDLSPDELAEARRRAEERGKS